MSKTITVEIELQDDEFSIEEIMNELDSGIRKQLDSGGDYESDSIGYTFYIREGDTSGKVSFIDYNHQFIEDK